MYCKHWIIISAGSTWHLTKIHFVHKFLCCAKSSVINMWRHIIRYPVHMYDLMKMIWLIAYTSGLDKKTVCMPLTLNLHYTATRKPRCLHYIKLTWSVFANSANQQWTCNDWIDLYRTSIYISYAAAHTYVTGFAKTVPNGTRDEFHFIAEDQC